MSSLSSLGLDFLSIVEGLFYSFFTFFENLFLGKTIPF